ncbi:MAG: ester cyclase [Byssovorax sp.]
MTTMITMRRSTAVFLVAVSSAGLFACGGSDSGGTGGMTSGTGGTMSSGTGGMSGCDEAALGANKGLATAVSLEVFLKDASPDKILSPSFVAHFPGGQPDQDLQAFLGFGAQFRAALPDAAFTFTHVIADKDLVALRYIGTGTHQGTLFGVPPSGASLRWEGMVIRRVEAGLVVEEWNAPDSAGLFGQLTGKTGKLSPDDKDHTGKGSCDPALLAAEEDLALEVSTDVVLKGGAPDALIDAGFVMHNPNGIPDQDLNGFMGFNAGLRAAFPDADFTFTHTFAEGGLVTLRYTATGTHSADFLGVPATGKKVAWEGMVIRRIDAGKLAEEWNAPDLAGLMGQLTAP